MTEFFESLKNIPSWAGSVPGWIMAASFLGVLWKGLPALLDSLTNSVAREREHREREIKRLEMQIAAGDARHSECMEGQRRLRDEMAEMRREHAQESEAARRAHVREVDELRTIISGMVAQMRQFQITSASLHGDGLSPAMLSMIDQLDKVGKQ